LFVEALGSSQCGEQPPCFDGVVAISVELCDPFLLAQQVALTFGYVPLGLGEMLSQDGAIHYRSVRQKIKAVVPFGT